MRARAIILLLAALPVLAQEQSAAPAAAAEAAWLPPVPTVDEVLQLPEAESKAARAAIKQVLLDRTLRLKAERRRLTPENSAECAAAAEKLHAPEAFTRLMQIEAREQLSGRALYEHQHRLEQCVRTYGVDALQIRLFVECLPFTEAELRELVDWLPKDALFNLTLKATLTNEELETSIATIADIYTRMAEVYAQVNNREQADAAAQELLPLLLRVDTIAPARLVLQQRADEQLLQLYESKITPLMQRLAPQRARLHNAAFYGSRHLAALDYLLS